MVDSQHVGSSQARLLVLSPGGPSSSEVVGTRCSHSHAVAAWVRARVGLSVVGGSITPRARAELEKGCSGALSPSRAAPRTSWDAFPSRAAPATAVSYSPVRLVEEPRQICCLGSPRHPHQPLALGYTSQSEGGLGTRCVSRCHVSGQLFCLGSVLWALEAAWGCSVAGLDAGAIQ